MLHYVALAYPVTPTATCQGDYRTFLSALQRVLPCQKCRSGFKDWMQANPPTAALASGRDALFDWTVALHNSVNEKTGKFRYDPRVARRVYDAGRGCRLGVPRHTIAGLVALTAISTALATALLLHRYIKAGR
jgi:hypothetical protein